MRKRQQDLRLLLALFLQGDAQKHHLNGNHKNSTCNFYSGVYNRVRTFVLFQKLNRRPDGMVEMKQAT